MQQKLASFGAALITLAGALAVSSPAHADGKLLGLDELIAGSTHVLLTMVRQVTPAPASGDQMVIIDFDVDEAWLGTSPGSFSLQVAAGGSELPPFVAGHRYVALMRADSSQPGSLSVVGVGMGMQEVPDQNLQATRELMVKAIALGPSLKFTDVADNFLAAGPLAQRVLDGALLEQFTPKLTPADLPVVADMACDPNNQFVQDAQLWAIARVGQYKIASARPCMEQLVTGHGDLDEQISASEALGGLADAASVTVLMSVLERRESQDGSHRHPDGGLTLSAILSLGKIGDPKAVPTLMKIARVSGDLAIGSTIVNALGLIGRGNAIGALTEISHTHKNPLVREQAQETLDGIKAGRRSS